MKSREDKIDRLRIFCPLHYCYYKSCGCTKPTEKVIQQIKSREIEIMKKNKKLSYWNWLKKLGKLKEYRELLDEDGKHLYDNTEWKRNAAIRIGELAEKYREYINR